MRQITTNCLAIAMLFGMLAISTASHAHASVIINNFNAQGFNGDGVGDSSNVIVNSMNGDNVTFTTRALSGGGSLWAATAQLGYNRDQANGFNELDSAGFFDDGESWAFDSDHDLSLLSVEFAAFSESSQMDNADIVIMQSDDWIGLAGVAPADPRVSYDSAAGAFTFTAQLPLNGFGIFPLNSISGGVALPIFSGTDIVFTDASLNPAGWQLDTLEFDSGPLSQATPVPEPTSLALFVVCSTMGVCGIRLRRRSPVPC